MAVDAKQMAAFVGADSEEEEVPEGADEGAVDAAGAEGDDLVEVELPEELAGAVEILAPHMEELVKLVEEFEDDDFVGAQPDEAKLDEIDSILVDQLDQMPDEILEGVAALGELDEEMAFVVAKTLYDGYAADIPIELQEKLGGWLARAATLANTDEGLEEAPEEEVVEEEELDEEPGDEELDEEADAGV